MVMSCLVPKKKWSEDKSSIICIHRDEHAYPTAEVYLTVGGQTFSELPYSVILSYYFPTTMDLVQQADDITPKTPHSEAVDIQRPEPELEGSTVVQKVVTAEVVPVKAVEKLCNMVTTRAQSAGQVL